MDAGADGGDGDGVGGFEKGTGDVDDGQSSGEGAIERIGVIEAGVAAENVVAREGCGECGAIASDGHGRDPAAEQLLDDEAAGVACGAEDGDGGLG